MSDDESPEEVAYRLRNEQRCAEIARRLKAELDPEGLSFVLVLATRDGGTETPGHKSFSNVSYVSTMNRDDSARLLTELVDTWWSAGTVTEPSVRTLTILREMVHKLRGAPLASLLTSARHRARDLGDAHTPMLRSIAALALACDALTVFDVESRRVERERKADA